VPTFDTEERKLSKRPAECMIAIDWPDETLRWVSDISGSSRQNSIGSQLRMPLWKRQMRSLWHGTEVTNQGSASRNRFFYRISWAGNNSFEMNRKKNKNAYHRWNSGVHIRITICKLARRQNSTVKNKGSWKDATKLHDYHNSPSYAKNGELFNCRNELCHENKRWTKSKTNKKMIGKNIGKCMYQQHLLPYNTLSANTKCPCINVKPKGWFYFGWRGKSWPMTYCVHT